MGYNLFVGLRKLDHMLLEDLHRAEDSATDTPNDSGFSNPFVFDHVAPAGNVGPTPIRNSDGSWPLRFQAFLKIKFWELIGAPKYVL